MFIFPSYYKFIEWWWGLHSALSSLCDPGDGAIIILDFSGHANRKNSEKISYQP